jgi:hypothetical protein
MSETLISQNQSSKSGPDKSFLVDLEQLENDEFASEYSYDVVCHLNQMEKLGFVNPFQKITTSICTDANTSMDPKN